MKQVNARSMRRHLLSPHHLARRANQAGVAIFAEEFDPSILTSVQFFVLDVVQHNPGVDAATMADGAALDPANLGEVLDRLERKGFLRRTPGTHDKRTKHLFATPEGEKILAEAAPAVRRFAKRMNARLSNEERDMLVHLLRKYIGLEP